MRRLAASSGAASVLAALGVLGAASQVAQAVLARELLVVRHRNEDVLGAFFGAWLAWIGGGGRRAPRGPSSWLCVVESAGALAGGALFTFVLAPTSSAVRTLGWLGAAL